MGKRRGGAFMDDYFGYDQALDAAHKKGLDGIDTEFLQFPTKENAGRTIIKATVTGSDGKKYSAIGDSAPDDTSLSNSVRPHWIRMAETRAKGRALRDYVNKGTDPEIDQ